MLLTVYYPRRSQKSMGATGRKMSSFLLTQYTGSYLEIFLNNIIKMWEQFRILEFPLIVLFILIGGIFLISSSDLVYELSTIVGLTGGYINPFLLCAFVPIKIYSNTEAEKSLILKDNQNKSGIYMWTNNINNKKYIGSSENLKRRFSEYFNQNNLIRHNCMQICRALLKHDYFNFSLTILEYCSPDKCLIREKHYWDIYKPEYNISQDPAAPFSGRTHSDATKIIMSYAKKGITGENHPKFGKNISDESKKRISDTKKGSAARESTRARCAPREESYVW